MTRDEKLAGAVRRTPRSAPKPPAAWWSPTEGFWSTNDGPVEGLRMLDTADEFRAYPPPDAVELVGPDQRRPVVLLRAEDCACPVGGDCPHGPEPVDALDLALWLHAEAAWRVAGFDALTVSLAGMNKQLTAERDALKVRIDAALAEQRPVDWPAVAEAFADEIAELNPPAPRVFFPGDTVPAESAVMDGDGRVFWSPNDATYGYPVLDIELPYLEEWQATVNRARAEREDA